MHVKDMINKYSRSNPHALNRPEGHIATKGTHKETYFRTKGNKVLVTTKDVRDTVWRNTALAKALDLAARS